MKTYEFIARGCVQGVGFRFYTLSLGNKYNLMGEVKNLSDGSVLILCQGEPLNIISFKNEIIKGNRYITVDDLTEKTLEMPLFKSFKIRY